MRLFHFSEDPSIRRFTPHVPVTNPDHPARVWAIDEVHQPAYWFPRDCPRVTVWRGVGDPVHFRDEFETTADRLHAIERGWLDRVATTTVYRYELPPALFEPWQQADGQWIAEREVQPLAVEPLIGLIDLHRMAGIELRTPDSLWALYERVVTGPWPFSIIRMVNAAPKPEHG